MIPVDQITYSVTRDHLKNGKDKDGKEVPHFDAVASLPKQVADGAVPEAVTAHGTGSTKEEAISAAQVALLAKLIGHASKPVPAAKIVKE